MKAADLTLSDLFHNVTVEHDIEVNGRHLRATTTGTLHSYSKAVDDADGKLYWVHLSVGGQWILIRPDEEVEVENKNLVAQLNDEANEQQEEWPPPIKPEGVTNA